MTDAPDRRSRLPALLAGIAVGAVVASGFSWYLLEPRNDPSAVQLTPSPTDRPQSGGGAEDDGDPDFETDPGIERVDIELFNLFNSEATEADATTVDVVNFIGLRDATVRRIGEIQGVPVWAAVGIAPLPKNWNGQPVEESEGQTLCLFSGLAGNPSADRSDYGGTCIPLRFVDNAALQVRVTGYLGTWSPLLGSELVVSEQSGNA